MGADLYENIRKGNWLLEYVHRRVASALATMPGLANLCSFMEDTFALVKSLPASLRPKFACMLIEKIYQAATYKVCGAEVKDWFTKTLKIACI